MNFSPEDLGHGKGRQGEQRLRRMSRMKRREDRSSSHTSKDPGGRKQGRLEAQKVGLHHRVCEGCRAPHPGETEKE